MVFPTPFTPTTITTYGFFVTGVSKSSTSSELFSVSKAAISSRRITFSSFAFIYFSSAARFSIRSIIFNVVSTPTSEVINTSSRLSSTSSSTFDLPAIARAIFPNTLSFVLDNPLSNVSFFSFEKKLKNPIVYFFVQYIMPQRYNKINK